MMDDLWVVEFSERAAPRLKELTFCVDYEMPAFLAERLERLRQAEQK